MVLTKVLPRGYARPMRPPSPRTVERASEIRSEARRELITSGLSAKESAFWCAAWEDEAERQGLRADSAYFWDAGRGWIDAQRQMPVHPVPSRRSTTPPAFSVTRS